MIYLDSSVALAWLLSETRAAPDSMWNDDVVSSRLLEYEVWNRIHARQLGRKLGEQTQALLNRIDFVELEHNPRNLNRKRRQGDSQSLSDGRISCG